MVAAVCGIQVILWLGVRLTVAQLFRQLRKLMFFLSVIFIAYCLVGQQDGLDDWHTYTLFGVALDINHTGAAVGLLMVLRIIAIVLASQIVRAGSPQAISAGLRRIGVPQLAALSIDVVLALVSSEETDKASRPGGGGGQSANEVRPTIAQRIRSFAQGMKRLAKGDSTLLLAPLLRQINHAEQHVASQMEERDDGQTNAHHRRQLAADVAIIAGVALTMLGIKALKLLPGLPFAPGHKGVLLIPLYIAAGFMTKSRAGASLTGLTMGCVAFLLGDGRYGIFEIAKHIAPGVIIDLIVPLLRSRRDSGGIVLWSIFGIVIALGRFATITAIAFTVQAPALVYALLIPGLTVHILFGLLSGIVTRPLVRALMKRQTESSPENPPPAPGR